MSKVIDLEAEFTDMIEYGDGTVTSVEVLNEMLSWPGPQENEIDWAYVALAGEGFSEAIAVVVSKRNGAVKITDIEWGRP